MSFSAEEELKFEVFKNKELENQLAQQKALLDEAVKVIKINLCPVFNDDCEGCREAERMSRAFLEKVKK